MFLGIQDGTWDTVKGCCTVIRDFGDFCYHSYRSFMQDLRTKTPPDGEHYEIRFVCLFCFVFFGLYIWLLYHLSHLELKDIYRSLMIYMTKVYSFTSNNEAWLTS